MGVKERLIEFIKKKGLTVSRFESEANLSNGYVSKIVNGIGKKENDILEAFPELNMNWVQRGIGEMLNTPDIEVQKIHNPPYRESVSDDEVPVYDIDAAANLRTLFETKQPNILDTLRIPNLPKCDGAVYVRGDSMYPILKSGDIVAYKQIHSLDYLVFGEMYLIDFNLNGDFYLAVKYITKSEKENYVKLVSYNTHHEPMDIPISSINAIAMIKASVRINTMM